MATPATAAAAVARKTSTGGRPGGGALAAASPSFAGGAARSFASFYVSFSRRGRPMAAMSPQLSA